MLQTGQKHQSVPMPASFCKERPVLILAHEVLNGDIFQRHSHAHGQIIFGLAGVLRVTTDNGTWVLPPQRAVWIPAHVEHEVISAGRVSMRPICVHEDAPHDLPTACIVIEVSNLLRAAVERLSIVEQEYEADSSHARIAKILLDEIVTEPNLHFHLPMPESKIVRIITEGLLLNPADPRTLLEWAEHAGASNRSLSRYFRRETGMTFREWRTQLHILEAIARLSQGDRVTDVAYDLGFSNPSSFIALFSKALNVTPGNYLKSLDKKPELSAEIGSYAASPS